jgi:hypothetical protein
MPDYGDKYNIFLVSEEQAGKEGEWYELGDLEKVRSKFSDFEPDVRTLLDMAKPEDCYIWRLSEMPPHEDWVSESGKIVIVGDAAHAMLPYTNMVWFPIYFLLLRKSLTNSGRISMHRRLRISSLMPRESRNTVRSSQSSEGIQGDSKATY